MLSYSGGICVGHCAFGRSETVIIAGYNTIPDISRMTPTSSDKSLENSRLASRVADPAGAAWMSSSGDSAIRQIHVATKLQRN